MATVATDQLTAAGLGSAERVWLLAGSNQRVRLIDLPPAITATRPAEHPPGWPDDETSVA